MWGRPPVGRWRKPRLGPARDPISTQGSEWATEASPHWVLDADGNVVAGVVIDFGVAAAGFLELWTELSADRRLEVRVAESLGALDGRAPECYLLPVSGRGRWRSPAPRRFRYAWLESETAIAARLLAVDGLGLALSDGGEVARERSRGPFGLEAPRRGRYQPLEVDLRDRKKRSP